eukprot:7338785-Prorocentrum_lima.AAC.1
MSLRTNSRLHRTTSERPDKSTERQQLSMRGKRHNKPNNTHRYDNRADQRGRASRTRGLTEGTD